MRARRHQSRNQSGRAILVIGAMVVFVGALFLTGFIPRLLNQKELVRMQQETVDRVREVRVGEATPAPFEEQGNLPGNISAIQYTTIFARVDGYLKTRLVDIGDHVKKGQLLAEIETPTIDEELAEAKADFEKAKAQLVSAQTALKQAQATDKVAAAEVEKSKANEAFAKVTAVRWDNMAGKGAVSIQSRDEKNRSYEAQVATLEASQAQKIAADEAVEVAKSNVSVAKAQLAAQAASVARVAAKQNFKYVTAPFDGVITLRKVDAGALITSGSQSQSLELFQLAKIDDLRIYVNAPQAMSRYLAKGQLADVSVPEFPERKFEGDITNISGALDPQTRTRQTEVHIANKDHALLPGMYAEVQLRIGRPEPWLQIDSNAIVPKDDGDNVVLIKDGKAHYQKVVLGRDFGDTVEIRAGLTKGDVVIISPPVDLMEGEPVKPVKDVPEDAAAEAKSEKAGKHH